MPYTSRDTCRICGSSKLVHVFSIGDHYVNNFVPPGKAYEGEKCPIELVRCAACSLVQNPHTAPQELLYRGHYWYKSGTTDTMRTALRQIVTAAMKEVQLQKGDIVLDIGANDGTLLGNYPDHVITVGCEPATNLQEELANWCEVPLFGFWDADQYACAMGTSTSSKAKIVTAIGMFYDLEDPNQFIADIKKVLHPDGVFIAQLMCLENMLAVSDFGNLAHEHLEYYTLKSLEYLLNKHGLEVYRIEINATNGQSYRLYIQHKESLNHMIDSSVPAQRYAERDILQRLEDFYLDMETNKKEVVGFIRDVVSNGQKVWVYGASTKGNTILQYFGLTDAEISGAAERDPDKWGLVTIGSNITITSEETARLVSPDYFLVLPYAFLSEFLRRETKWRTSGGKFIVPFPKFRLV